MGDTVTGRSINVEINFFPLNANFVRHQAAAIPKIVLISTAQNVARIVSHAALTAYSSVIEDIYASIPFESAVITM